MRKSLQALVAGIIAISAVGASGSGAASANLPARITICYNVKTLVVRFAHSGRCGPASRALVVGRGNAGPLGRRGPQGSRGAVGPAGSPGAAGGTGPAGTAGPAGGTGLAGPAGTAGPAGGTGLAGPAGTAGVNVFHTVLSAPATSGFGTLTALCDPGEVVTGGGFTTSLSGGTVTVKDSSPTAARDGWLISYSGGATIIVVAYAICVAGVNM